MSVRVEFVAQLCYTSVRNSSEGVLIVTKIDVFSGFLGAGKTTLIKKLISEAYVGEKLVLIENEFGEIGIDAGFMKEAGIQVNEMNSGCICCSLVGDFKTALTQVLEQFAPDRILIEPSGVGKLSDVIKAVKNVENDDVKLNSFTAVVDALKCKVYAKNFGEFYNDQIENAGCIILSRTQNLNQEKLDAALSLIREKNRAATIVTTPWDELDGVMILAAMEHRHTLVYELEHMTEESCPVCGGHYHDDHHHHDEDCGCHDHHHHHDEDCGCHDHHHHHDEDCDCHEHHHDEECGCHDHHHDHHHHHHADDVFSSWGVETICNYSIDEIRRILEELNSEHTFGTILRAKGIVKGADSQWIHFDYVPGDVNVRYGGADVTGKICVIGASIKEDALKQLFHC